ncbi:hypothetical protein HYH03_015310 [Edaphochlamys debaryana]|uniref:HYR domain-containing protein n=1 Tax=Edaphochlamys debaryana TaxID=47281 RepID=A0A835XJN7_9CHLO|nr:hypothetical protein HYH03_015310 [Edaphochlamys debaryana]|eukprot:KAG2485987.1 hypothetical protein HYH03_015310 [Edaphochlamys debaryana]
MTSGRILRFLAAVSAALVLMSGLVAARLLLQSNPYDDPAYAAEMARRRPEVAAASLQATGPSSTGTRRVLQSVVQLTADQYAEKLLDPDSFELISAQYTGVPTMSGFIASFPTGHALKNDFPDGAVVLTSGDPTLALRTSSWSGGAGLAVNSAGDADVSAASGYATYDAAALVVKVMAKGIGKVSFRYVFASDEYNEYVGSQFIDAFVLLVNGTNTATLPGTDTPVTINTISYKTNVNLFVQGGAMEYDGHTVVLNTKEIDVVAGSILTIKMAVADASDHVLDSAVFIQYGSVSLYNSCDLVCDTPPPGVGPCKYDSTCLFTATYQQYCGPVTNKADAFDTTPPVLTPSPASVILEGDTLGGYTSFSFGCTAQDAVDGAIAAVTYSPKQPGDFFPIGTTEVTCSATDAAGNTGTATITVVVQDTTPPVLTPYPESVVTREADTLGGYSLLQFYCTAVDIVDGSDTISYEPMEPPVSGNTGTTTITVIVQDTKPPVVTPSFESVTLEGNTLGGYAPVDFGCTAEDIADGPITAITYSPKQPERCSWTGFLPPIENKDYNVLTTTTASIPVKWLMGGMDFGTSGLLAPGYPRLVPITCGTDPAPTFTDVGSYLAATANDLKYTGPQYHMNFKYGGLVKGGCYRVDVMLTVCDATEAGIRYFRIRVK